MMFGNELFSLHSEIPFWNKVIISNLRTQLVVKKSRLRETVVKAFT